IAARPASRPPTPVPYAETVWRLFHHPERHPWTSSSTGSLAGWTRIVLGGVALLLLLAGVGCAHPGPVADLVVRADEDAAGPICRTERTSLEVPRTDVRSPVRTVQVVVPPLPDRTTLVVDVAGSPLRDARL